MEKERTTREETELLLGSGLRAGNLASSELGGIVTELRTVFY